MNEIKDLIYEIRGKQVMLDSDLSKIYGCANGTKSINLALKRNKERFPNNFCFQLTNEEFRNLYSQIKNVNLEISKEKNLRFQFETSKNNKHGGTRYLPYVFTEQGVAMLSAVLKTANAVQVSINIINAFVEMRKFILNNAQMFERLTTVEYKLLEHDDKFNELFNFLDKEDDFKEKIFYEGKIYDAYSLIVDIISRANRTITIIDNYIDKTILDLLSYKNTNVTVRLITNNNKLMELDISKFNSQYPSLDVIYNNSFHDRFIIIDDNIYHLGASLKDLGKKCFAINKMEDRTLLDRLTVYI